MILKQEQAKLAASSIENIVNGGGSSMDPKVADPMTIPAGLVASMVISTQAVQGTASGLTLEAKAKEGPNRCSTCRKRVGLTGFNCRCGNLYCAAHRYSEKHDCQFDYQTAGRDAIAKANPVVKANKLDKI